MLDLLIFLVVLPVPLLFVNTGVPRWLTIGLLLVDFVLLVILFRLRRSWTKLLGGFLSLLLVAVAAVWLSQLYNNVLFRAMKSPTLELVLLLVPQFAREYGLVDRVNFARGLLNSFPVVYGQLHDLDFESQAATLQTPVYFLVGREDVNAMASLVERYYNGLQAPHKESIWLASGHGATAAELTDALVNKVLVQSPPLP